MRLPGSSTADPWQPQGRQALAIQPPERCLWHLRPLNPDSTRAVLIRQRGSLQSFQEVLLSPAVLVPETSSASANVRLAPLAHVSYPGFIEIPLSHGGFVS